MEDKILLDYKTRSLVRQYDMRGGNLQSLADFFGALSDSTRIRIVSALSISEMCVGDLSKLLEINQTTVSDQLKSLRVLGIVDYYRQGKIVFYYIKNKSVLDLLSDAADCI